MRPSGKHVLEFKHLTKLYDDHKVIDGFTANVLRGEKICLMGRNGAGKTTLLKSLLANYPGLAEQDFTLDSGAVFWGHEAQIGYFPQDVGSTIEHGLTVAEWLHRWNPAAHAEEIRGILGQMLFSGEEGSKPTKALSGGEQARLVFCKLILTKPNILIFDEPTNHLDLEAINALNIALQRYEGTVLLVTHDHDLIDEVATRLWNFTCRRDRRLPGAVLRSGRASTLARRAFLFRTSMCFRPHPQICSSTGSIVIPYAEIE